MNKDIVLSTESITLSDIKGTNEEQGHTFSGVANSGKPFSLFGENSIIDLNDLSYKDKIPALDGHDRGKRVGIAQLSVRDNELMVTGTLLANTHGKAIADDAKQGFPWELSVHAQASSVENIGAGETTVVNGASYTGPLKVMHGCKIREVSFTPVGVDSETEALVLSDEIDNQGNTPKTLKEALAEIVKLKKKIKQLQEEEKKHKVDSKLALAGFSKNMMGNFNGISNECYELLLSINDVQADAMITAIKASNSPIPEALLCETTPPNGGYMENGGLDVIDKILMNKGVVKCQ